MNPSGSSSNGNAQYGGAVKIALMNLINTNDLDQVIEECAPRFAKKMEMIQLQNSTIIERLESLQKNYEELQKQNQELLQIVKNK
jgi:archaellum component FlaC